MPTIHKARENASGKDHHFIDKCRIFSAFCNQGAIIIDDDAPCSLNMFKDKMFYIQGNIRKLEKPKMCLLHTAISICRMM